MRPLFLDHAQAPPPHSLGVDGGIPGCAAVYSHWKGYPAPEAIAADTSTAILLRASRDPARWLTGFDHAVNDHIDTDGLLALALACCPAYGTRHAALLVGAAAYGDFGSWPGATAARLALRLHRLISDETAAGTGWEQRCCDRVVADLDALVVESAQPHEATDAQIEQILQLRQGLMGARALWPLTMDQDAGFTVIRGVWCHGHNGGSFTGVHAPDDCPVWALDGLVPHQHHRLLGLSREGGSAWWLEAPPHSWAHTVRLPSVAWPDCAELAGILNAQEPSGTRWAHGDGARRSGFTCLLASVDGQGQSAASRLPDDDVVAGVRRLLAHDHH